MALIKKFRIKDFKAGKTILQLDKIIALSTIDNSSLA